MFGFPWPVPRHCISSGLPTVLSILRSPLLVYAILESELDTVIGVVLLEIRSSSLTGWGPELRRYGRRSCSCRDDLVLNDGVVRGPFAEVLHFFNRSEHKNVSMLL